MVLLAGSGAVDQLVSELDVPGRWLDAAVALTADLGFRLVEPDPTGRRGPVTEGHLLVALRGEPTLRHFDPESISYYGRAGEGAALTTVARIPAGAGVRRSVLWGHVHVVDRVPVENRFLTFGGELELVGVDAAFTIAHLRSPAPIVRWGGHSQGTDPLTLAIGAFFGRLIVPVDFQPGAAARIDAASPEVLFSAFLCDATARGSGRRRFANDLFGVDRWLAAAWVRARTNPEACDAGERLLEAVGLRNGGTSTTNGPARRAERPARQRAADE